MAYATQSALDAAINVMAAYDARVDADAEAGLIPAPAWQFEFWINGYDEAGYFWALASEARRLVEDEEAAVLDIVNQFLPERVVSIRFDDGMWTCTMFLNKAGARIETTHPDGAKEVVEFDEPSAAYAEWEAQRVKAEKWWEGQ